MKHVWKKFASLLMVVICAFAMSACGNVKEEAFQLITDEMVENCKTIAASSVEALASFDQATLDGYKTNRNSFTRLAVEEWDAQTDVLGAYKSMGEATTVVDREEGEVIVKIPAEFENNAGEIEVYFNYNADYDQMVPAYISVKESRGKPKIGALK